MPVQFSCPISGVGGVKQFGMCVLNTESELREDESHRNSWAEGDAHIHLLYHGALVPLVRASISLPTIHFLSSFPSYHKVCTANVHEIFIFAFHRSHSTSKSRLFAFLERDACVPTTYGKYLIFGGNGANWPIVILENDADRRGFIE